MKRSNGFTLLELMIVVVIIAIIAMMAGPSISDYIDKRKIINAAEAIYSQLQFARSQAISRSSNVHVRYGYTDPNDAATWLLGITTNANCILPDTTAGVYSDDCTMVVSNGDANLDDGTGDIDPNDLVYHVISGDDFNGVELDDDGNTSTAPNTPNQFSFNSTRGTAANEMIHLTYDKGDSHYAMRVVIGMIGRVRICTPTDTGKGVPGYTPC